MIYSVARVIINLVRGPMIVFYDEYFEFKTRFGSRAIRYDGIQNILIKREKEEKNERYVIVKIRVRKYRRWFRVRVNNFDNSESLYKEFVELRTKLREGHAFSEH